MESNKGKRIPGVPVKKPHGKKDAISKGKRIPGVPPVKKARKAPQSKEGMFISLLCCVFV